MLDGFLELHMQLAMRGWRSEITMFLTITRNMENMRTCLQSMVHYATCMVTSQSLEGCFPKLSSWL